MRRELIYDAINSTPAQLINSLSIGRIYSCRNFTLCIMGVEKGLPEYTSKSNMCSWNTKRLLWPCWFYFFLIYFLFIFVLDSIFIFSSFVLMFKCQQIYFYFDSGDVFSLNIKLLFTSSNFRCSKRIKITWDLSKTMW